MTKKYLIGTLCYILMVVLFVAPFIGLYFIKQDVWVVQAEGFDIAVGVIIGLIYMGLVFLGALKKIAPLISMLFSVMAFMLVTYFFDSIINDLFYVIASVALGLLFFIVFYKIGKRQFEIAKIYADEGIKIKARKDAEAIYNAPTSISSGRV